MYKGAHQHTFPASEEDLIVTFQPLGHVVGVENGHLCGMKQSFGSHHLNTERRSRDVRGHFHRSKSDEQNCHWTDG